MSIFLKMLREPVKMGLILIWDSLTKKPMSGSTSIVLPSGYDKEKGNMQITNLTELLSPHFTIGEMTHTNNVALQTKNRNISDAIKECLVAEARLMEIVRVLTGNVGIDVNSGYRCPELNGSTPGASVTSQHILGQACDFFCPGQTSVQTFDILKQAMKNGKFFCGQLIHEIRGTTEWVHVSLGDPVNGKYTLLEQAKKPGIG